MDDIVCIAYDTWVAANGCDYCKEHIHEGSFCILCSERWLKDTIRFDTEIAEYFENGGHVGHNSGFRS